MVFNTTHTNEDYDQHVLKTVGPGYSLIERLKMGRIGSKRMIINDISKGFWPFRNQNEDLRYGNIELRQNGIIVHLAIGRLRIGWVIPYRELFVFDSETFSLHGHGLFLKFEKGRHYHENKSFIRKMMNERLRCLEQYTLPHDLI